MDRTVSPLKIRFFRGLMRLNYPRLTLFAISYLIVIFLILFSYYQVSSSKFKIGELSRYTVRSEFTLVYADTFESESLYNSIESNKPFYFSDVEKHTAIFNQSLQSFLSILKTDNWNDFLEKIQNKDWRFSSEAADFLFKNRRLISRYTNRIQYLYNTIYEEYTVVDQPGSPSGKEDYNLIKNQIAVQLPRNKVLIYPLEKGFTLTLISKVYPDLSREFKNAFSEIFINLVQPTAVLNPGYRVEKIKADIENLRKSKMIHKDEYLIQRGELITQDNLAKIIAYSDYKKKDTWIRIPIIILLSLLLYIFLIYRFYKYETETFEKDANIILALVGFILSNFIFYFCGISSEIPYLPHFLIMPFAIVSITLPILLMNNRVAIILLISYSFYYLFYPTFDVISYLNLVIISFATIYTAQILKNRNDFFKAALLIGIIELLFAGASIHFTSYNLSLEEWTILALFAMGNGLICSILSSGTMPILENALKIPTRFRLLELTNPTTSPLLKLLKTEAPGTYNHSILLGDMCEAAAERLGIDSLLVKAGGYYHDIGKTEIPEYFIENQEGKNRHDDIKPSFSVSVLKSHVRIGVELSKEYHLPEEVIDYIREHHGTTAISYFYHQALDLLGDENVNIEDYEYPGPKPQTKGTALLMLADGIEASVRAYSVNNEHFTTNIIEDIIDDIVRNRMDKGQFDDCDITLHDLKIISEEFFKFLAGYYHKRIEYKK